jgi:hypothetical protein
LNHFAHARVAAAHARDPLLALGAMLPDFAAMLRERIRGLDHPTLRAGAVLHVASDAAFHAAPAFVAALTSGGARLRELGVSRGPARAAAHVGIELCLDAELAREAEAARIYRAALVAAARPEIAAAIAWRGAGATPRWRALHARLSARGAPRHDATPEALAQGVARALASRPRLALDPRGTRSVVVWLGESAASLRGLAHPLLERVVRATGPD